MSHNKALDGYDPRNFARRRAMILTAPLLSFIPKAFATATPKICFNATIVYDTVCPTPWLSPSNMLGTDVAVSPDGTAVFSIGADGASIYQHSPNYQQRLLPGAAVRIAARIAADGSSRACVVNSAGGILCDIATAPGACTWQQIPGAAVDIGCGGTDIWVVGTDHNPYRWNGSTAGWDPFKFTMAAGCAQVAVDTKGNPTFVAVNGQIVQGAIVNRTAVTWTALPLLPGSSGQATGLAADVAIDSSGRVWAVGASDGQVWVWNAGFANNTGWGSLVAYIPGGRIGAGPFAYAVSKTAGLQTTGMTF